MNQVAQMKDPSRSVSDTPSGDVVTNVPKQQPTPDQIARTPITPEMQQIAGETTPKPPLVSPSEMSPAAFTPSQKSFESAINPINQYVGIPLAHAFFHATGLDKPSGAQGPYSDPSAVADAQMQAAKEEYARQQNKVIKKK